MALGPARPSVHVMAVTAEQRQAAASPDGAPAVEPTGQVELLMRDLRSSPQGLSGTEARRRLLQYGPNELHRRGGLKWPAELGRQLTHPLALLLWLAAALSFAVGSRTVAIAVLLVIALNAVFALIQEMQAERAVEALAQFLPQKVRVLRDGASQEIVAVELVPGDVVLVEEGDRIAADMRMISGAVEVDLSTLNGESAPALRSADLIDPSVARIAAQDLLFSGTSATGGEARGVVFATGMRTELGRIAALSERVKEEPSPLETQVRKVAWLIAAIAIAMAVAFVPVAIFGAGLSLKDSIVFAVGLLAGNVPEGLLPVITLALAVAVSLLARRGALVKRLSAVETLGSTDVICTDKTGTLTENRMNPVAVWTLKGEVPLGAEHRKASHDALAPLAEVAWACNNAHLQPDGQNTGDPTEIALLQTAEALGVRFDAAARERARRHQYNFDPQRKLMSTLDACEGHDLLATKGAPEAVLPRCSTAVLAGGEEGRLERADRERVTAAVEGFAGQGLRVLALARKLTTSAAQPPERDDAESGLCFLGLVTMQDPPRPAVADAVARCHAAGIRIILITGDHPLTAAAIAGQVGIGGEDPLIVNAQAFDHRHEQEVRDILATGREVIFARASPETKLQIAEALRSEGHVVAMTGDGVNDAPALRTADIGVAMGRSGTDVAREAIDDGADRRQLRDDRGRDRGGTSGLRQRSQVHPVHLRSRNTGGHTVPSVRARRWRDPAPPDRDADPRLRRRNRDAALACARARPDRAGQHGSPATPPLGGRDPGSDAGARVAVPRRDGLGALACRLLLRPEPCRLAARRSRRRRPSPSPRLPPGHDDDLRRNDRRADRHRLRGQDQARLAAIDRCLQQPLPAARDRGRAGARGSVHLRASAAVAPRNSSAAAERPRVPAALPVHRLGCG